MATRQKRFDDLSALLTGRDGEEVIFNSEGGFRAQVCPVRASAANEHGTCDCEVVVPVCATLAAFCGALMGALLFDVIGAGTCGLLSGIGLVLGVEWMNEQLSDIGRC